MVVNLSGRDRNDVFRHIGSGILNGITTFQNGNIGFYSKGGLRVEFNFDVKRVVIFVMMINLHV